MSSRHPNDNHEAPRQPDDDSESPRHSHYDPEIGRLDNVTRGLLADHWRSRARAEATVGRAFAAIHHVALEADTDPEVLALLARTVLDEERHARLAWDLACQYAPQSHPVPLGDDWHPPDLGVGASRIQVGALLIAMSCINETIGSAWLEASARAATATVPRRATQAHLRDELDHARVGWAFVASPRLSTTDRAHLSDLLPMLFEATLPGWLIKHGGIEARGGLPAHGIPGNEATRRIVLDSVRDVVIPGLAHVGLDARPALDWLAETE